MPSFFNTVIIFSIYASFAGSIVSAEADARSQSLLAFCPNVHAEIYTPTCLYGPHNKNCNAINISAIFALDHFQKINDVDEWFAVSGSLKLVWSTCSDYNPEVEEVMFYPEEGILWRPHINHRNSVNDIGMLDFTNRFYVECYNDTERPALFEWQRFGVFTSSCEMDLTKFPFDVQQCSIDFQLQDKALAAVFDSAQSNFVVSEQDFMSVGDNWRLVNYSASYYLKAIDRYGARSYASHVLTFRRIPTFFIHCICVPTGILTLINIAVIFMDGTLPDRASFGLTVMLAFTFFEGQILGYTPVKPQQMFLTLYTELSLYMSCCCTVYYLISCWYLRTWRNYFKNELTVFKFTDTSKNWTLSRGRAIDILAFVLIFLAFLALHAYVLAFVSDA